MEKVVGELRERALAFVEEYVVGVKTDFRKKELWKKSVQKACRVTEGIDEEFANNILKEIAIQRHFAWLTSNKSLDDIYHSFIITMAFELCEYDENQKFAISFGEAILDNWFEANDVDYIELKGQIVGDRIVQIVNNRERLYREYFMLYDDPLSRDVIRVYYPKNGESWISWDKNCCIDIKINLSKGTEYGFCRVGFSYGRVQEQETERLLKIAYISDDKEIFRFEHDNMLEMDDKKILWAM